MIRVGIRDNKKFLYPDDGAERFALTADQVEFRLPAARSHFDVLYGRGKPRRLPAEPNTFKRPAKHIKLLIVQHGLGLAREFWDTDADGQGVDHIEHGMCTRLKVKILKATRESLK